MTDFPNFEVKIKRDDFLNEIRKVSIFEKLAERRFNIFNLVQDSNDISFNKLDQNQVFSEKNEFVTLLDKIKEIYSKDDQTAALEKEIIN